MGKIKVSTCDIEGLYFIEPTVFGDKRGYFMETYNQNDFKKRYRPVPENIRHCHIDFYFPIIGGNAGIIFINHSLHRYSSVYA